MTLTERQRNALTLVVAVLLTIPAYLYGVRVLSGREWPTDPDLLRDAGSAQAILDGHFGKDPLYLGETAWYPPLMPLMLAGLSKILGVPVLHVAAKAGIHMNLLPLGIFVFVLWRMFGRLAALCGLAGFLYLANGRLPLWCDVGLDPDPFSISFFFAAFPLGLYFAHRLIQPGTRHHIAALAGLLLGITFLGHPSTAMMLCILFGSVMAVDLLRNVRARCPVMPTLMNSLLIFGIGAIGAWLLLHPLYEAYGMHSRNHHSTTWQHIELFFPNHLARTPWTLVLASVGLACILRRNDRTGPLILFATAIPFALFIWSGVSSTLANAAGRIVIPSFVPAYHFHYHFKLMLCVLFAVGTAHTLRWAVARPAAQQFVRTGHAMRWMMLGGGIALLGAIATAMLLSIPQGKVRPYAATHAWLLQHTRPDDVILASNDVAMYLISPAGRKAVASDRFFSNPYVELASHAADRDSMFHHLSTGHLDEFMALAGRYDVRYVIPSGPLPTSWPGLLTPVFEDDTVRLYRLTHSEPAQE